MHLRLGSGVEKPDDEKILFSCLALYAREQGRLTFSGSRDCSTEFVLGPIYPGDYPQATKRG